ncbi:MAG: hypothetical protein U5R14_03810 [Gemmatimonadota bacterium]|nr:hypothetical protein [Gemmatimonadota bacterium]
MRSRPAGVVAVAWTLVGVSGLFAFAVLRLGGRGVRTILEGLAPGQWLVLLVLTFAFVYGEGVMSLQRRWVPRLIERARSLRDERRALQVLAPLYGLSLVGAPAKRLLRAWLGTFAIITAVLTVRTFPDPWRGIVDFAVAGALVWGLLSIAWRAPGAFRGPSARPEPASEPEPGRGDSGRKARVPDELHRDDGAGRAPLERDP